MRNMEKSRNFKVVTKIKLQVFFFFSHTHASTDYPRRPEIIVESYESNQRGKRIRMVIKSDI